MPRSTRPVAGKRGRRGRLGVGGGGAGLALVEPRTAGASPAAPRPPAPEVEGGLQALGVRGARDHLASPRSPAWSRRARGSAPPAARGAGSPARSATCTRTNSGRPSMRGALRMASGTTVAPCPSRTNGPCAASHRPTRTLLRPGRWRGRRAVAGVGRGRWRQDARVRVRGGAPRAQPRRGQLASIAAGSSASGAGGASGSPPRLPAGSRRRPGPASEGPLGTGSRPDGSTWPEQAPTTTRSSRRTPGADRNRVIWACSPKESGRGLTAAAMLPGHGPSALRKTTWPAPRSGG